MDTGIADTINRRDARQMAMRLDALDYEVYLNFVSGVSKPWYRSPMADTLMGENDSSNSDRAWLVGLLAASTAHLSFDGGPADGDWENLFANLRAEISARRDRDPKTPPAEAAEPRLSGVV